MGASQTPLVLGVAGKCCAGKDEVVRWLLHRGWREINVDRIGHEALAKKRDEIVSVFGIEILSGNEIDRGLLGNRVFRDPKERRRLESIVHPWMRGQVRSAVEDFRSDSREGASIEEGLVINAALLFPMQLDELCDYVILVRAPFVQRLIRARRRDRTSLISVLRRFWSQRHLEAQASASPADTIIVENGRSRAALYEQLSSLRPLSSV